MFFIGLTSKRFLKVLLKVGSKKGDLMGEIDHISGHTKTIAVVGTPIKHSLSPAMHNTSFTHLGIDCVFLAYDVADEKDLEAAIRGMNALGFIGCNITMPYKTKVLQYLDELSPAAEIMGAVNTVVFKEGKAIGHNTDGAGFMKNVRDSGVDVIGKKITLVGAGGAGSAIYTQAALDGVSEIDVFNRKDAFFEQTKQKIVSLADRTGCKMKLIDLDDQDALRDSVAQSVLFVNATRVGMPDTPNQSTLNPEFMVEGLAVADTVYEPRKTKLIKDADSRGLITIPGLGMLLSQAAIGEEIWVNAKMPIKLIEDKFFN